MDGEITVANAALLLDELKPHIADKLLTLDFSGVMQVDSTVLALMLSCQRAAAQHNYRLHFSGLSSSITTLADLYGVETFLQA